MTRKLVHKHTAITVRAIGQLHGVPYELERTLCRDCRRLLDEKPLKRAAAA